MTSKPNVTSRRPALTAKQRAMATNLNNLTETERKRRLEAAADREYALELIAERLAEIERRITNLERKRAEQKAATGCYRNHI